MKIRTPNLAISFVLALSVCAAMADDKKLDPSKLPPAAGQKDVTYAKDIKPILDKSCVKCHGGEKPKGKLRLETLEGAIKGSKDGPVIVAGKSGDSLLVYAVAQVGDEDDFMPPPKNKANIGPLTKEQVGLIRAWIDQGAK
jgi:uncharacterized membrane protein